MSSHFRWYPSESEIIVPWNARYSFPSQSNKTVKMTPRIPPINGSLFNPGNVIRIEIPSVGYINPANTSLSFDVTLLNGNIRNIDKNIVIRFQNNIQSCFSRVRLLYGSTPIEDISNYNQIVRSLTEWTGSEENTITQKSINEGIGNTMYGKAGMISSDATFNANGNANPGGADGVVNIRQSMIHGVCTTIIKNSHAAGTPRTGLGFGVVPNGTTLISPVIDALPVQADLLKTTNPIRRYQVQLALGLFNQPKLIPTKFMASKLVIEIVLANAVDCIYALQTSSAAGNPTYQISNVNLLPEILEFDSSYDEMFLKGLMNNGVPLKFATWNSYEFRTDGATSINLNFQERARSVKSIFVVQKRPPTFNLDSGATYFTTGVGTSLTPNGGLSTLQEFQFRVGGRYFPSAPVQNATTVGGDTPNGGAEAWIELSKALNHLGDGRLATGCNVLKWAVPPYAATNIFGTILNQQYFTFPDKDYRDSLVRHDKGAFAAMIVEVPGTNAFSGNIGSCCFAMAIDLETSSGGELSGLNGEEQSDISLLARWNLPQNSLFTFKVLTYIDAMIVLRENNVLELIK